MFSSLVQFLLLQNTARFNCIPSGICFVLFNHSDKFLIWIFGILWNTLIPYTIRGHYILSQSTFPFVQILAFHPLLWFFFFYFRLHFQLCPKQHGRAVFLLTWFSISVSGKPQCQLDFFLSGGLRAESHHHEHGHSKMLRHHCSPRRRWQRPPEMVWYLRQRRFSDGDVYRQRSAFELPNGQWWRSVFRILGESRKTECNDER